MISVSIFLQKFLYVRTFAFGCNARSETWSGRSFSHTYSGLQPRAQQSRAPNAKVLCVKEVLHIHDRSHPRGW